MQCFTPFHTTLHCTSLYSTSLRYSSLHLSFVFQNLYFTSLVITSFHFTEKQFYLQTSTSGERRFEEDMMAFIVSFSASGNIDGEFDKLYWTLYKRHCLLKKFHSTQLNFYFHCTRCTAHYKTHCTITLHTTSHCTVRDWLHSVHWVYNRCAARCNICLNLTPVSSVQSVQATHYNSHHRQFVQQQQLRMDSLVSYFFLSF